MTSSKILLLFALCALASIASASNSTLRFRNYANYANSSNHTNHTNTTNHTAAPAFITFPSTPTFQYPAPISSNHSNRSNHSNTTNHTAAPAFITFPSTPTFQYPAPISSNHSNHSNHSNTTNHTAAPAFITFPSVPFFQYPAPTPISSNHSNHSNHSNSTCTRVIAGQTFDLCAFKHPINASFYFERYAANFTLSFLNSSVSDCNGTYGSSWMTARNNRGQCVDVRHGPTFNLTRQYGESGLKIDYHLGAEQGGVSVHLICNRTAPHNAHLDFAFNRTSNNSLIMTAQSFYGCPVNSSVNNSVNATIRDFGRKFLEF